LETHIAWQLRQQNVECYVPLICRTNGRKAIELPLFPGYIFAEFREGIRSGWMWSELCILEGLSHSVVADDLQILQRITKSGFTYGSWPYIDGGTRVTVVNGPLAGLHGFAAPDNRLIIPIRTVLRSVIIAINQSCDVVGPNAALK
jgi:hypothetical protein